MNNRKYTRLGIDVIAELYLADGSCLYGQTADLSLDGAFVTLASPTALREGDACRLVLLVQSGARWVQTEFQCVIVHLKEDGIGLRYTQASIQHHEAFLKLLIDGTDDVDTLLEELSHHPGTEFRFTGP